MKLIWLFFLSTSAFAAESSMGMGRNVMLSLFSILMVCYIAIRFRSKRNTVLKPMDLKTLIEPHYSNLDVIKSFFGDSGFPSILVNSKGSSVWMNSEYKKFNNNQNVFEVIMKTAIAIERNGSKVCFLNQKPFVINKFSFIEEMSKEKMTSISLLPTASDFDFSSSIIPNISDTIHMNSEGDELNNLLVETLKNVNYLFQVSGIIINFDSSKKEITTNIDPEKFVKQFSSFFQSLVNLLVEQNLNKIKISVDEISSRCLIDIQIPKLKVSNFQNSNSSNAGHLVRIMSDFEAMLSAYYFKANFRVHGEDLALQLSFNSLARHQVRSSEFK